jgi:replication factor C small subunit
VPELSSEGEGGGEGEVLAEKYRPKTLDEVVGQDHVIKALKEMVKKGLPLPHMLFFGPPGCGKTSTAHALANELKVPIIELNASDERGITTIRGKIKRLAQTTGYRIILLDECDQMTEEAQHALRRIMEKTHTTFILTANEDWKIIDPIKSRCVNFRFNKLSYQDMAKIIVKILRSEGVEVKLTPEVGEALTLLLDYTNGDMRRTLNLLETMITSTKSLTVETVKALIPPSLAQEALELATKGDWEKALKKLEDAYVQSKLEPQITIENLYKAIAKLEVPVHVKLRLYDKLAETERGIKVGCNPLIQLAGFLANAFASITELKGKVQ